MEEEARQSQARPPAQSDTNKILAALGYPIWIIALIMILTEPGKKDPFVKYHAWQALFLNIAAFIIGMVTFGIGSLIIWLISIYYAIQAYNGNYFEVPVIYGLAKKYME